MLKLSSKLDCCENSREFDSPDINPLTVVIKRTRGGASFSMDRRYLGAWTVGNRLLELSVVLKQLHQLELSVVLKRLHQQAADTDRRMLKDIQADILPDGREEPSKGRENKKKETKKGNRFEGKGQKKNKHVARSWKCTRLWAAAEECRLVVKLGLMNTFVQFTGGDRVEFVDIIKILCSVHKWPGFNLLLFACSTHQNEQLMCRSIYYSRGKLRSQLYKVW